MRKIKNLLTNQSGMAMPMVIVIVTAAVSTIAYLIVTLIPQLQDEQKKSQDSIDYKIFITSLNDYVVHAMREKWCVNKISYTGGILETDLLLSNDCSSTSTMEQMVKFEGNLERILWTDDTIGQSDDEVGKNTIIGLHKVTTSPATLTPAQIKVSEMKLRLSENVLTNMNDQHPLFVITRNIRKCVEYVDIEIKRDPNSTGEEVKIGINIEAKLSDTKLACLQSVRNVSSSSHYTFFPRRLHTYSLIKYGDLEAKWFHEYHGPVYVAGNLKLPDSSADKTKTSIFYNTLTLGIYNQRVTGGRYEAGKIVTNSNEPYTFEERGHPYLSKQDNYENFRGIIGGLRLDASEDKGISRIFDDLSGNSANVGDLEACIQENQVKTKPSFTAGSIFSYMDPTSSSGASIDSIRVAFDKKPNRFKPTINAPQVISESPAGANKNFILDVTSTNGTKEIGEFKVNVNSDNEFSFTTAPNSPASLTIDTAKHGLTTAILDPAIIVLTGPVTKDNYQTYLPAGHILYNSDEAITFRNKVEDFKLLCTTAPISTSSDCDDFLVDNNCPALCVNTLTTPVKNLMNTARDALRNKINEAKIDTASPAKIDFEINSFQDSGKEVINQKDLKIKFTPNWPKVIGLIKSMLPNEMTIEFKPYHYSYDDLKIIFHHNLNNPISLTRLKRQDNGTPDNLHSSGRRNSYNNGDSSAHSEDPKTELTCPDGMSLADWNEDMSESTRFAWNYANTPPGAEIEEATHDNLDKVTFLQGTAPDEGHAKSHTKSVVNECIVPNNRDVIFGFYACKKLTINPGRATPLYMIGTFIVEEIENSNTTWPVYWHSVWDAKAAGLIISNYFSQSKPLCPTLIGQTWSNIISNAALKNNVKSCSAMDLVTNGPNNFTWTTVDPEIGLIPGNTMTSEKVKRIQRWVIREDSRADFIR